MSKEFEQNDAVLAHSYPEGSDSKLLQQRRGHSDTSEFESLMLKEKLTKHGSRLQAFTCKAKVLRVRKSNKNFELEAVVSKERFIALRASSCLQVPTYGDLVLVQGFEDGSIYVMAVLESAKDKGEATRLEFPEESVIDSKSLTFNTTDFKVESKKHTIEASTYSLKANHATSVTTQYYLSTSSLKQNADKIDIVAKTATSAYVNSIRVVSDTDKVKALNIHYSAQSMAKFLGTTTKINDYEFIVVDGKLI